MIHAQNQHRTQNPERWTNEHSTKRNAIKQNRNEIGNELKMHTFQHRWIKHEQASRNRNHNRDLNTDKTEYARARARLLDQFTFQNGFIASRETFRTNTHTHTKCIVWLPRCKCINYTFTEFIWITKFRFDVLFSSSSI